MMNFDFFLVLFLFLKKGEKGKEKSGKCTSKSISVFLFLWEESSFFTACIEGTHFYHVFKGNRALGGVNTPGIPPVSGHFQHFCSIQGKVCSFFGGGYPLKF